MDSEERLFLIGSGVVVGTIVGGIALLMWGLPQYHVWRQGQDGAAELARAEQNRRIAVLEAQARLESEELNAQAEVARARGVAEANSIIADGLGGSEGYLRYLWIQAIDENGSDLIYIPTEANMPILEAGRAAGG